MKKLFVTLLVLALAGGGVYVYLKLQTPQPIVPVTVAVIDSGLDLSSFPPERKPRLAVNPGEIAGTGKDDDRNGKVDDVSGWNFFDDNADISDEADHGTQVVRRIIAECMECGILPLKVTKTGAGVRPNDIVNALLYAMERGARVVNLSFGVTEGSDELKAVVEKAWRDGVVLVAAAGVGVPNPFQAVSLSKMYPQAYPEVIVVGSARETGRADLIINHGPEMDVVQVQKVDSSSKEKRGSSFAAATISGAIGKHLRSRPKLSVAEVRAAVREATIQPAAFDLDRFGFGIFDPRLLPKADPEEAGYRVYGEEEEHRIVDFNSADEVRKLSAVVKCSGREGEPLPEDSVSADVLAKGRARLSVRAPSGKSCKASVTLEFEGGVTEKLRVSI